jgi:hypothetical protein
MAQATVTITMIIQNQKARVYMISLGDIQTSWAEQPASPVDRLEA